MKSWSRRIPSILILSGVGLAACQDDAITPPDPQYNAAAAVQGKIALAEQIAQDEIQKAVQGDSSRVFEHIILRLEAEVPSIGGIYFDRAAGHTVVIVTDKADSDRAIAAVKSGYLEPARTLIARVAPDARSAPDARLTAPVVARIGDYAFSKLVGWSEVLLPDLMRSIPAFVSMDANERSNRVEIGIEDDDARVAVNKILEANGVPAEAVTIVQQDRPSFTIGLPSAETAPRHHHLKHPHSYMGAGLQIQRFRPGQNPAQCSQGWTASYDEPNSNLDTWGYLTAGHCVDPTGNGGGKGQQWWHPSDPQAFPNEPEGINFGRVHLSKPYPSNGAIADAAFLAANDWRTGAEKRFAITTIVGRTDSNGSLDIDFWNRTFLANPTLDPDPGTEILKTGRTTGTTAGEITNTGATIDFGPVTVRNLIVTTNAEARPGDSGGPMFSATLIQAYGITVGSRMNLARTDCPAPCRAYFSPIGAIKQHLGKDFKIDGVGGG